MTKQYRYRAALNIISGGYAGEDTGTIPANDPWHSADLPGSGEQEFEYYYRDSGVSQNANSSRVRIKVKDTWTTSVNNVTNVITVNVKSVITSIIRDDVKGNPSGGYATTRNIYIRREAGGAVLRSFLNDNINTAHTIYSGEIALDTYSFTLEPGTEINRGTIYYLNTLPGHENDALPNIYSDVLWVGITFMNPLAVPTQYRISYNANGGAGAPADQTASDASGAHEFTLSGTRPTWGLYEFLGWSTRQIDEGQPSDVQYTPGQKVTIQEPNPTLTLYAVWRKNYIPGKSYKAQGDIWLSHNRPTSGHAKIYNGSSWSSDMKTIGGDGDRTGDPPYIYNGTKFVNQRRIGQE